MTVRGRLVGAVLLALVIGACAAPETSGTSTGVVVDVVGDLTVVEEFTITTGLRDRMTFVPAPDGEFPFPLPHLRSHITSGIPVIVEWERNGDVLYATFVDDAEDSPH